MIAVQMEIQARKYSTSSKDSKLSSYIPSKTTLTGLVGAFAGVKKGTEEFFNLNNDIFDIHVESMTPLRRFDKDNMIERENQIIVNANNPFKEFIRLRVIAIAKTPEAEELLVKVIKRRNSAERRSKQLNLYLGKKEYGIQIQNITRVNVSRIENTRKMTITQKSFIPMSEDIDIIKKPRYCEEGIMTVSFKTNADMTRDDYRNKAYIMSGMLDGFTVKINTQLNNVYSSDTGQQFIAL